MSAHWVLSEYQRRPAREEVLWTELDALQEEVREARKRIAALEEENAALKARLQTVHRRQFKANGATPGSAGDRQAGKKKRGAPAGHPPWRRPVPREVNHTIEVPAPGVCPHCGGTRLELLDDVTEHVVEDIVLPPRPVTTRFVHRQAYCRTCRRAVVQCAPGERLGAAIGPVTSTVTTWLRYGIGMSCRKAQRVLHELFGMPFVPASAVHFGRRASARGAPLYDDLRQKIKAAPVVHADETSWRQDGINHVVWFAGNDDLAVFRIDRHRSTEAAHQVLGAELPGTLVSDAYAVYDTIAAAARQSCLAHLIRRAKELGEQCAARSARYRDKRAIGFCTRVGDFFRGICAETRDAAHAARCAVTRRRRVRALDRVLGRLCKRRQRDPQVESFRKRLLGSERRSFFTCITDPAVPATNNLAERSLRPLVISRKLTFGTRSAAGSECLSVLSSLLSTAQRQGVNPLAFLHTLLTADAVAAHRALFNNSS